MLFANYRKSWTLCGSSERLFTMTTQDLPKTADDGSLCDYLSVSTKGGGRPGDTIIRLSNGHQLGGVQAIHWTIEVGGPARCIVETILTPAELTVLLDDTVVEVRLHESMLKTLWTYWRGRWRNWLMKHLLFNRPWFKDRTSRLSKSFMQRFGHRST